MSTTPNPMLEDLETLVSGFALTPPPSDEALVDANTRLRAFLSRPEVIALQDPGTAAAMRVLLGEMPGLMEMESKATDGHAPEWKVWPGYGIECQPGCSLVFEAWEDSAPWPLESFVVAARNAIHRAAQAKREAEKAAGGEVGG